MFLGSTDVLFNAEFSDSYEGATINSTFSASFYYFDVFLLVDSKDLVSGLLISISTLFKSGS